MAVTFEIWKWFLHGASVDASQPDLRLADCRCQRRSCRRPAGPSARRAILHPDRAGRPPADTKAWTLGIGNAPIVTPAWQGSRGTALSILPDMRLNYRGDVFLSVPDGLGSNAVNRNGWKLGPRAKLRFGRQESTGGSPFLINGGSIALRGMGDIDIGGVFGGCSQKRLAAGKLRLRAELRQGTGGHDGLVAYTNISWNGRTPAASLLSKIGLSATWTQSDYSNTYFGAGTTQVLATGLPALRTGSGLSSASVKANPTKQLGRFGKNGALTLFSSYDRLGAQPLLGRVDFRLWLCVLVWGRGLSQSRARFW